MSAAHHWVPGLAVVGDAQAHEHGAQVGVAQAQGPELVGQLGDPLGGELGHEHRDLQDDGPEPDGVPVAGQVEAAVRGRNAHRFRDARLHAVSSRNMYSLQGLLALMGRRRGRCASR